jgi:hypothetical protein
MHRVAGMTGGFLKITFFCKKFARIVNVAHVDRKCTAYKKSNGVRKQNFSIMTNHAMAQKSGNLSL